MIGAIANWRNDPVTLDWLDPKKYPYLNTVNTYISIQPLEPDFSQGYTGVEYGIRHQQNTVFGIDDPQGIEPVSPVNGYWLEWGTSSEEFHLLSSEQAPYASTADGRHHTFLLLGNDTGQWDLYYDYNQIATTRLQAGGSTRISRAGLSTHYPQAIATTRPFEFRMQLMDGANVWRRPYLAETGTGEPKTCETPPRYEDWNYGEVNLPPWCFTVSYTTRAPSAPNSPTQLDSFIVGKPGATGAAAPIAATSIAESPTAAIHHGVDQHMLAACINSGVENCLDRVPGLAACVAVHTVCNVLNRSSKPATLAPPRPMSAEQARHAAERDLHPAGALTATVTSTSRAEAARILRLPNPSPNGTTSGEVYVVASNDRVPSLTASNDTIYDGFLAIYDVATHQMLYACLGVGCNRAS